MLKKIQILLYLVIFTLVVSSCCDENKCDTLTFENLEIDPYASMPTQFELTNPEIDVLEMKWIDNCDWEVGYKVDRRIYDIHLDDLGPWENIGLLSKNSEQFRYEGAPYGTSVSYRIYAYYDNKMFTEAVYLSHSIYLRPPEELEIHPIDDSSLRISWLSPSPWIDGFRIEKITTGEDLLESINLDSNVYEFIDTDLDFEQAHRYKIYSVYEGALSHENLIGYKRIDMVYVEGGSFQMGNTYNSYGDDDEYPVHDVNLSSFYIGTYEVTSVSLRIFNDSDLINNFSSLPANVTWLEAIRFCNYLSEVEGLDPCYSFTNPFDYTSYSFDTTLNGFRLPTEAEWEYAARGGIYHEDNFRYSGSDTFDEVGWLDSDNEVGQKAPNQLGLYDMTGNAYEFCWDWYGTYPSELQVNPIGPEEGEYKVCRFGSDYYSGSVASRKNVSASNYRGLRVVRNAE